MQGLFVATSQGLYFAQDQAVPKNESELRALVRGKPDLQADPKPGKRSVDGCERRVVRDSRILHTGRKVRVVCTELICTQGDESSVLRCFAEGEGIVELGAGFAGGSSWETTATLSEPKR